MGMPGLVGVDAEKVRRGNAIMQVALRVARIAKRRGIPVTLENPQGSRMWWTPPMMQLLRKDSKV